MEGCFNYHWFGMACICCFRIYKKFEEINDVVVCSETGQNIRMKGDAMEKLTFRKQIIFGLILFIAANVLAFIFHNGIFSNFAWVIYGLLFIVNPVYPEQYCGEKKKAELGARIAGVLCVAVGLMTRFVL